MDIETFWRIIDATRRGVSDCEDQAQRLVDRLAKLQPTEIIAFDKHFHRFLNEAYRHDLSAVAFIVNGGMCSDDGFQYFRCWLIGQGRSYFEAALADAEKASRRVSPGDDAECESLLYAAARAYEQVTGAEDLPPYKLRHPVSPRGKSWEESELPRLYPKLAKKYGFSAD